MDMPEEYVRTDRRYDWVGPPHPISKIRPIKLRRVHNESDLERRYREAREDLNRWNSEFWAKHNTLFHAKKTEFIQKRKNEIGRIGQISSSDLSIFYKEFLDSQHANLMAYNNLSIPCGGMCLRIRVECDIVEVTECQSGLFQDGMVFTQHFIVLACPSSEFYPSYENLKAMNYTFFNVVMMLPLCFI